MFDSFRLLQIIFFTTMKRFWGDSSSVVADEEILIASFRVYRFFPPWPYFRVYCFTCKGLRRFNFLYMHGDYQVINIFFLHIMDIQTFIACPLLLYKLEWNYECDRTWPFLHAVRFFYCRTLLNALKVNKKCIKKKRKKKWFPFFVRRCHCHLNKR